MVSSITVCCPSPENTVANLIFYYTRNAARCSLREHLSYIILPKEIGILQVTSTSQKIYFLTFSHCCASSEKYLSTQHSQLKINDIWEKRKTGNGGGMHCTTHWGIFSKNDCYWQCGIKTFLGPPLIYTLEFDPYETAS